MKTERVRKVSVGSVKKSVGQISWAWRRRNARQLVEGGRRKPGDGRRAPTMHDVEAAGTKLTDDPNRTPAWVLAGHAADEALTSRDRRGRPDLVAGSSKSNNGARLCDAK